MKMIYNIRFFIYNFILSSRSGTSIEFLLAPLFTSTCFLMGETNVEIDEYQNEPCLLYCAAVANAATGKSAVLSIFKKTLRDIEIYNKIDINDSKVMNG
jgi:hypothetical protein